MKRTIYIALLVLLSLAGYYMLSPHNKLTFASLLGEEDSLIAIIETPQIRDCHRRANGRTLPHPVLL